VDYWFLKALQITKEGAVESAKNNKKPALLPAGF